MYETRKAVGLGLTLIIGGIGGYALKDSQRDIDVLPECTPEQNLGNLVPDDKVTETIGRTPVCRVDDNVFTLELSASQK